MLAYCYTQVMAEEPPIYVDSLTGAEIVFPLGASLKVSDSLSFYKCTATTDNSFLSVYSMKNINKEAYSWSVINQFDANNKYGKFLGSEKITGLNIEGWFRYYEKEDKYGKYINCITALRGSDYALYFVESCRNKDSLISSSVVNASNFKQHITLKNTSKQHNNLWQILMWGSVGLPFLLFFFRKKMGGFIKWTLRVLFVIIGTIAFYMCSLSLWEAISGFLMLASLWWLILEAKDWDEIWFYIENILKNLK